jgi:hypothetical protein
MGDETTTADDEGRVPGREDAAAVMGLLAEHVPLTLLADLAVAEPRSEAILQAEGLPDDAWWEGDDAAAPGEQGARRDAAGGDVVAEDDAPADPDASDDPHGA